jgi:hypothetical protein
VLIDFFSSFASFVSVALGTSLLVIIVTFVIVIVMDLDPLAKQFLTSLVIGLLVSRLLWIFQSQLMLNLMLGYELDRALILRKTEPSVFATFKLCNSSSAKISSSSEKGLPSSSSICNTQAAGSSVIDDEVMVKNLAKFSKLKHKAELDAEIDRVKGLIRCHQVELACLENMIFASEHDSKSQSQSGRPSSRHESGVPVSPHSQVESGVGYGRCSESVNEKL